MPSKRRNGGPTIIRMTIPVLAGTAVLALAAILFRGASSHAAAPGSGSSGYRAIKSVPVGGDGFWDYLTVDSDARRLYISHSTHVSVMDTDTYAIVGDIPDTQGVHGIALAPHLGRGFTSNGRANTVTIFDLKTLKTIGTVKAGTNPDAIVYDGVTKRVFTMNGRSHDATAIHAAEGAVAGTLELGGKQEFDVAVSTGSNYVHNKVKSEIVRFDAQKLTILHRWPLEPCEEPSGL